MSIINRIVPKKIKELIKRKSGVPDIFSSIEQLKKLGFDPQQTVDVGAYEGEWTKRCLEIFPTSQFLMVEAMEKKKEILYSISNRNKNIKVEIALVGASSGTEVFFSEKETASSVLEEVSNIHMRSKKIMSTLSDIVERNKIVNVDFLKLDVQGYELEVLKGFDKYMENIEVILTEVSLLDIHKETPLIRDVLNFMDVYNFVVYDICSVNTRRPLDNALWQTDLLFVKKNSWLRSNKAYK